MSGRPLIAFVRQRFKCKFEMPSGPMEEVFFYVSDGLTNHLFCG